MSSNKPFDFGAESYHDPDPGIIGMNFCHRGIGRIVRIVRDQPLSSVDDLLSQSGSSYYYAPPLIGGGIKRCCCLTSICLSDWRMSVCRVHRA